MAIYLPGTAEDQALALDEMTPREIVAELDKYVVGQGAAVRVRRVEVADDPPTAVKIDDDRQPGGR